MVDASRHYNGFEQERTEIGLLSFGRFLLFDFGYSGRSTLWVVLEPCSRKLRFVGTTQSRSGLTLRDATRQLDRGWRLQNAANGMNSALLSVWCRRACQLGEALCLEWAQGVGRQTVGDHLNAA